MAVTVGVIATLLCLCPGIVQSLVNEPHETTDQMLPTMDVSSFSQDPMFKEMETKIEALQKQLRSSQDQAVASLQQKKEAYEKLLREDQSRSEQLRNKNDALKNQIEAAHNTTEKIRRDAQIIVLQNNKLSKSIELFLSNLTLAQEFANSSIQKGEINFSSPQLSILSELNDHDQETRSGEELSRMMADIEKAGLHLSLYQLVSPPHEVESDVSSATLVQSLSDSLDDLPNRQQASADMLTKQFNVQHGQLQATIEALTQEQTSLNETLMFELDLQKRLSVAKDHLSDIHAALVKRSAGLQGFASKLGSRPVPVSLLQLGKAQKNKTFLSDPSDYMEKPREVLKVMNDNVDALESRLTDANKQHAAEVRKQKAAFEEKLSQQERENRVIEETNKGLDSDVKKLQETNQELRTIAKSLVTQNSDLRTNLQTLLSNVSYAHEFTEGALSDAHQKLQNASALQVLRDEDAKDAAHLIELEHARSLKAVADPSRVSMLETGAHRNRRQHPDDLLQMLAATLNDLAKEQNASVISLQEKFDAEFHTGELRRLSLLDIQSELNATKANESELKERLKVAVEHLKTTREKLLANIHSVQGFMATVSKTALPRKPTSTSSEQAPAGLLEEEGKQEKHSKETKKYAQEKEENHSKKIKKHAQEKAVLVQVPPKMGAGKVAAKGHQKGSHSTTRGHQKLVEGQLEEHEHVKQHGETKVSHASAEAVLPSAQDETRSNEFLTAGNQKSDASGASSWFSWLQGVVGKARQAMS